MLSGLIARSTLVSALAAVALVLAACSGMGPVEPPCQDGGEQWIEYRLLLGRNIGDAEAVSDQGWEEFIGDTVTPRFPDGLSVIDSAGQWRGEDGRIVQERSKMLLILAPTDTDALEQMNEISVEYKRRFGQESVLQVVSEACVTFQ